MRLLQVLLKFFAIPIRLLTLEHGSIYMGQAWQMEFDSVLHMTFQQMDSLLSSYLDGRYVHTGVRAAIDHFERLGNVVANDNVVRHGQTKQLNPTHSKRAVFPVSSDGSVLLANIDEVRTLVNPQSAYMQTIVAALKRRQDQHIINASVGSANIATVATDGSITYSTQAMLTKMTKNATGSSQALAQADIVNAGVLLSKGGVPSGARNRIALYSPGQLTNIMNITQASSSDFTRNRIWDEGTINGHDWEGFHWIEIQDAVDEATNTISVMLPFTTTTTIRATIFMGLQVGAVAYTENQGVQTKISERPDLNDEIQTRAFMTMGAVRMWEGAVVEYKSLEN